MSFGILIVCLLVDLYCDDFVDYSYSIRQLLGVSTLINILRYLNVLQSRLRNRCSALNSDLYRANLIPNALCSCGKSDETDKHFVLHC
jgi:hypothetical protein